LRIRRLFIIDVTISEMKFLKNNNKGFQRKFMLKFRNIYQVS